MNFVNHELVILLFSLAHLSFLIKQKLISKENLKKKKSKSNKVIYTLAIHNWFELL